MTIFTQPFVLHHDASGWLQRAVTASRCRRALPPYGSKRGGVWVERLFVSGRRVLSHQCLLVSESWTRQKTFSVSFASLAAPPARAVSPMTSAVPLPTKNFSPFRALSASLPSAWPRYHSCRCSEEVALRYSCRCTPSEPVRVHCTAGYAALRTGLTIHCSCSFEATMERRQRRTMLGPLLAVHEGRILDMHVRLSCQKAKGCTPQNSDAGATRFLRCHFSHGQNNSPLFFKAKGGSDPRF